MVGYAWMNALHSVGVVATLTHPTNGALADYIFAFAGST